MTKKYEPLLRLIHRVEELAKTEGIFQMDYRPVLRQWRAIFDRGGVIRRSTGRTMEECLDRLLIQMKGE